MAIAVGFLGFAAHAELPPDVLAKNRWTQLTRADYEAALQRIPEKSRFEFATSPKRVQDLLNTLLLTKTLAAQAKAHGTRPPLEFGQQRDPSTDSDRALADAELKRIDAEANRSFDASKAAFEAKALELYKANPEKYQTPEEVRISDIAVLIQGRGDEAARLRADEARTKVAGGADFATIAREYSDDPTSRDKGGALPLTDLKRLAPDYAKGVAKLTRIGEVVSEPIKGRVAYHVVRLDERRSPRVKSFDEVRESIMDTLRKGYVAEQRDVRIREIFRDAGTESNQAAMDALVNRVDPEAFRTKRSGSARSPRPQ